MIAERPTAPEDPVEIDIDHVEPVLVGDRLGRGFAACDARVVDQDVDPAVTADHPVGDLRHLRGIGDIHDDDFGIVTLGAQRVASRLRDACVPIGDDHLRAGLAQRLDAAEADGPAASRHEGDPVVQFEFLEVHETILP